MRACLNDVGADVPKNRVQLSSFLLLWVSISLCLVKPQTSRMISSALGQHAGLGDISADVGEKPRPAAELFQVLIILYALYTANFLQTHRGAGKHARLDAVGADVTQHCIQLHSHHAFFL